MRLRKVKIRNFRCYIDEVAVDFDSLTSIIGRNDAGKSTILEALAIFFDQQKPDIDDAAKDGLKSDMSITCEFDDLPEQLIVDSTSATTLADEYLLNADGLLEVRRTFNGELKTPTSKVFIRANHPSVENAGDLLMLKNSDLKKRATDLGVDLTSVNQRINAELRSAIRAHIGELELKVSDIEVDTSPGAKELYMRLKESFPAYFLFRSDRSSTDQDSEAQDPMRVAVRLLLRSNAWHLMRLPEVCVNKLAN